MKRNLLTLAIVLFAFKGATSQDIIFGTNNYIEYQKGTLPIVISVPHGGYLTPSSIPDRTCQNPVYATDAYTIETALDIKNSLLNRTGCYPHLIICHLHRRKLDCNRNISAGACGNPEAETAWNEFHGFITTARNTANLQFNHNTFFVDLHGHGNPIQRIELGYLLYDYELELSDNVLNTSQYINYSSIKNLALNNVNNYSHAQLLRGPKSFGTLLSSIGYPSVPSQQIPYPGTNTNYFSGGYITANHTCYASGVNINGLQLELNYSGIRNSEQNRILFSNGFADAIIEYLNTHFDMNWGDCSPINVIESTPYLDPYLYPNPVKMGYSIWIFNAQKKELHYEILNLSGLKFQTGKFNEYKNEISLNSLVSGFYIVKIFDANTKETKALKLIVD